LYTASRDTKIIKWKVDNTLHHNEPSQTDKNLQALQIVDSHGGSYDSGNLRNTDNRRLSKTSSIYHSNKIVDRQNLVFITNSSH
jgi:hypothetical protein